MTTASAAGGGVDEDGGYPDAAVVRVAQSLSRAPPTRAYEPVGYETPLSAYQPFEAPPRDGPPDDPLSPAAGRTSEGNAGCDNAAAAVHETRRRGVSTEDAAEGVDGVLGSMAAQLAQVRGILESGAEPTEAQLTQIRAGRRVTLPPPRATPSTTRVEAVQRVADLEVTRAEFDAAEDARRRVDNRAKVTHAHAMAASLAFDEFDQPDWDKYAAYRSDLTPEVARRWERTLESQSQVVQRLADAIVATAQVAATAVHRSARLQVVRCRVRRLSFMLHRRWRR